MRVRIVLKRRVRARREIAFQSPLPVSVRTAVLRPGFAESPSVRVFPGGWSREVEAYRPELVAAPLTELRYLAAWAAMRRIEMSSLDCALVVFTGDGQPCLTDADRDLFWRVFQVPLFEQYLDSAGRLAAAECDAHLGLHLLAAEFPFNGREGFVESAPCPCGRAGPRVLGLREAGARAVAAAAR